MKNRKLKDIPTNRELGYMLLISGDSPDCAFVMASAMARFMLSSPVSYMFFISFINPPVGSSSVSFILSNFLSSGCS